MSFFLLVLAFIVSFLPSKYWVKLFIWQKKRKIDYWERLAELENELAVLPKDFKLNLGPYKFYTALIEKIIVLTRSFGADGRKMIRELRGHIYRDQRFEKQIREAFAQGILQIILAIALIWVFAFCMKIFLQDKAPLLPRSFIIALQFFSLSGYVFALKQTKKIFFKGLGEKIESLISLKSLHQIGLPLERALAQSQVIKSWQHALPRSPKLHQRLWKVIERHQRQGNAMTQELNYLLEELWAHQEQIFERLQKAEAILRFLALILCGLGGHFILMKSFLGQILTS